MALKSKDNNNLRLAFVFSLALVFFIFLSILVKIIFLVKDSRFNGHNLGLEVVSQGKISVVSFSPQQNFIYILNFEKNKNIENLEIPIDEKIDTKGDFNSKNLSSILLGQVFKHSEKLTMLDYIRLYLFNRSVKKGSIIEDNMENNANSFYVEDSIVKAFKDPEIVRNGKTIQIVNTTQVSGLGSRLATLVSNMGGDVILVSSQEKPLKSKIVYFKDIDYTVKRLASFLDISLEKTQKKNVADIVIIIGNDSLKDIKY